jgi:hypothetical protein
VTFTKENFSAIWEKKQEIKLLGEIPLYYYKYVSVIVEKMIELDKHEEELKELECETK